MLPVAQGHTDLWSFIFLSVKNYYIISIWAIVLVLFYGGDGCDSATDNHMQDNIQH